MSDYDDRVKKAARALRAHLRGHPSNGSEADHWRAAAGAILRAAGVPELLAEVERLRAHLLDAETSRDDWADAETDQRARGDALAATVARVEALRDRWNTGSMAYAGKITANDLTAALSEPTEGEKP